ncbi:MAG: toxic anion resistance protein [Geminicoccaceae bacterium]|nr:toxic anion resistance protein [Geminicoccaceae bacterium]
MSEGRTDLKERIEALSVELSRELHGKAPAPAERAREVQAAKDELDLKDAASVLFFGSGAQDRLSSLSDEMLEEVKGKDLGPAGDALGRMVATLRGIDFDALDPSAKQGFLERLFGGAKNRLAEAIEQYDSVRGQVDRIGDDLERHKGALLKDIVRLDKLYDANLDHFRTLEVYVEAGKAKLKELDEGLIPELQAKVEASDDVVLTQELRDLRSLRDDLERRVHDLLLTRQVTMQSLPSIRLIQENDKALIARINSTLANTVPLWRQQMAQAITVWRAGKAATAVRAATDLTNELLVRNAETLNQVNRDVRKEVERGIVDIEAVKAANDKLIQTIEESLQIADEGKARRRVAEGELGRLEAQLKESLGRAKARVDRAGAR